MTETKTIEVDYHTAQIISHALVKRLQEVRSTIEILRIAKERKLNNQEYWQLPTNMQRFSREELLEQIDPWISLEIELKDQIKVFTFEVSNEY